MLAETYCCHEGISTISNLSAIPFQGHDSLQPDVLLCAHAKVDLGTNVFEVVFSEFLEEVVPNLSSSLVVQSLVAQGQMDA